MHIEAFFCEFEDTHEVDGELINGCITYPVVITTEHSSSSHGQPAVIIDGEALGPIEMPSGELQLPEEVFDLLAKRLRDLGYAVCNSPVDKSWMECWENGIKLDNHWHPEARLVSF